MYYLNKFLVIPKTIVHLPSFLRQDKQKDHQQRIVAVVSLKSGSREPGWMFRLCHDDYPMAPHGCGIFDQAPQLLPIEQK
jgi:hypothetical protein